MKNVEQIAKGEGYTAINMGSLEHIGEYSIVHQKLKTEFLGKLFLKDLTGSTGIEISFNTLPPHFELFLTIILQYLVCHKLNKALSHYTKNFTLYK